MNEQEGISTFKCENHENIVSASKLVWAEGMQPARIVLCQRKASSMGQEGVEYVTYRENLILVGDTWKHRDFYWGHYFGTSKDSAVKDFHERSEKL